MLPPQRGWEWQSCRSLWHYSEGGLRRGRCSDPGCLEFSGGLGGVSYATTTVSGWLSPRSAHVQLAQKYPQNFKKEQILLGLAGRSAEPAPGVAVFSLPNLTAVAWGTF